MEVQVIQERLAHLEKSEKVSLTDQVPASAFQRRSWSDESTRPVCGLGK